jgi:hypothetical protein
MFSLYFQKNIKLVTLKSEIKSDEEVFQASNGYHYGSIFQNGIQEWYRIQSDWKWFSTISVWFQRNHKSLKHIFIV